MTSMFDKDVFNSLTDEKYIPWRNLPTEKKLEILDIFFEENSSKNIEESSILMLRQLVKDGKLKLKKEVKYDEVNKKIISISDLILDDITGNYIYKTNIKKKEKRNIKNLLFRT